MLLGSMSAKAERRTLMKMTPDNGGSQQQISGIVRFLRLKSQILIKT